MEAMRHARHFLGLSARDMRVFAALSSTTGQSATAISHEAKVPRTTAYEILEKLRNRGFVRTHKDGGNRTLWKRQASSLLKRHMRHSETLLGLSSEDASQKPVLKTIYASGDLTVDAVRGGHELIKVYTRAFSGYEHERILLTQIAPAVRALYEKTSGEEIRHINNAATAHKTILEVLMTESTKKEYAHIAERDPKWSSHASQRMVDISIIPDDIFANSTSELLIFRDKVLLTDWKAETGFIITSEQLATMLRSMFRATKAHGATFDNNRFLQMLADAFAHLETHPS